MSERSIRVIVTDDHPVVRRGLAAILETEDDIEVVGEAENGVEAVALALARRPDVILMDLQMPGMDGVAAIEQLRTQRPEIQVIVLTTFADEDYIYKGIAAGARGYLLKDAPPEQLIEAVRAAFAGKSLLNSEVAARILDRLSGLIRQVPLPEAERVASEPKEAESVLDELTSREMEVLKLMGQGARNKEIAEALVIAERTVKIHVGNILGKLNVSNRTEAVALAMRLGLLDD